MCRFNEGTIRVLESFLASNDFKYLDGVVRALKQFVRNESLCIIQEIAGKSTEHKLLIVDFLVRVFALIGDTEVYNFGFIVFKLMRIIVHFYFDLANYY